MRPPLNAVTLNSVDPLIGRLAPKRLSGRSMQILLPVTVPVRPVISVGYCTTLQFPGVVWVQPLGRPSLVGLPAKKVGGAPPIDSAPT